MDLCYAEAQRWLSERKAAKGAAARSRDEEEAGERAGESDSSDHSIAGRARKAHRGSARDASMGAKLEPTPQSGPGPRPMLDTSTSPIKEGAPILKVAEPWFSLLLDGAKTWEIRGSPCLKEGGTTGAPHARCAHSRPRLSYWPFRLAAVYLERIGDTQKVIRGALDFQASIGPLSAAQWTSGRLHHCVSSDERPYGERTFAWQFTNPRWFVEPKRSGSGGGQIWAKHYASADDADSVR